MRLVGVLLLIWHEPGLFVIVFIMVVLYYVFCLNKKKRGEMFLPALHWLNLFLFTVLLQ